MTIKFSRSAPGGGPARSSMMLIRASMVVGVLLFAAVTWWLHRQEGWTPAPTWEAMGLASYVVSAMALAGILMVRKLANATGDRERLALLAIAGGAIGEGAALFGGVYYFFTDDPSRMAIGLAVLVASFLLIPTTRE